MFVLVSTKKKNLRIQLSKTALVKLIVTSGKSWFLTLAKIFCDRKTTIFYTNRTQISGLGPSFWLCSLRNIFTETLLACSFFPSYSHSSSFQSAGSKRFIPLARLKKGTAVRSCAWLFGILIFCSEKFLWPNFKIWQQNIFNHYCFPQQIIAIELCSFPRWIQTQNIFLLLFFRWIARQQLLNRINFCFSRKCNTLLL